MDLALTEEQAGPGDVLRRPAGEALVDRTGPGGRARGLRPLAVGGAARHRRGGDGRARGGRRVGRRAARPRARGRAGRGGAWRRRRSSRRRSPPASWPRRATRPRRAPDDRRRAAGGGRAGDARPRRRGRRRRGGARRRPAAARARSTAPAGRWRTSRPRRSPTSPCGGAGRPSWRRGPRRRRPSRRRSTSGSSSPPARSSAWRRRPTGSTCEYARERHTWGVPIGAYQAVAHPLADGATAIDGARLLVGKAAWELQVGRAAGPRARGHGLRVRGRDRSPGRPTTPCTSTAATASCSSTTRSSTTGGRGAGPGCGASRATPTAAPPGPATAEPERPERGLRTRRLASAACRDEVRAFLERELPPELEEEVYRSGASHDADLHPPAGRAAVGRPGLGPRRRTRRRSTPSRSTPLDYELTKAEAPTVAISTTEMVASVIRAVGTDELKAEILPRFLRGEITIALGMTEPEVGSDVAGVQHPGPPRRRPVDRRRAEDVHDERPRRRLRLPPHPHAARRARSTPASRCSSCRSTSRASRCRRCTRCPASGRTSSSSTTSRSRIAGASARSTAAGRRSCWRSRTSTPRRSAPTSPGCWRRSRSGRTRAAAWTSPTCRPVSGGGPPSWRWRSCSSCGSRWMEANGQVPGGGRTHVQALQHRGDRRGAAEDLTELVGPDALRSRLDPTALGGRPDRARACASRSARRSTRARARSSGTSSPSRPAACRGAT